MSAAEPEPREPCIPAWFHLFNPARVPVRREELEAARRTLVRAGVPEARARG